MTTALLILFILAVAISPLLQMVPSKRQRRQAAMREQAAIAGLFVEFRSVPGEPEEAASGQTIFYGLRWPRGHTLAAVLWHRRSDRWYCQSDPAAQAPELLQSLPEDVVAASVNGVAVGVYWQEQGGADEVAAIASSLQQWQVELQGPEPGQGGRKA